MVPIYVGSESRDGPFMLLFIFLVYLYNPDSLYSLNFFSFKNVLHYDKS